MNYKSLYQNKFISSCLGQDHFLLGSDPMISWRSDQNIFRSEVDSFWHFRT